MDHEGLIHKGIIPPTYISGVLQARAYRVLRSGINEALKDYDISMTEWAILGLIFENKTLKLVDLAKRLEVEAPLITDLINGLIDKKLVKKISDVKDKRAKLLALTNIAIKLVPEIEDKASKKLTDLFQGVDFTDMLIYIKVLLIIGSNNSKY